MSDVNIKPNERLDDLHRNGYMLIQDPDKFCFGVDAVLLSGFAKIKKGEKALDLGTGTGVIPILLCGKTKGESFAGLEIQPDMAEMARRSVEYNGLSDKIEIKEGDIKEVRDIFGLSCFDVVTVNPPYMQGGSGIENLSETKAIARHEVLCSLEDVISGSSAVLKPQGRFYMIHRPHRLADIICLLREKKLEPKTLRFVFPHAHKEPTMVLVEAMRGGKSYMKVMPPLVIYNDDGSYTKEIYEIYYK